MKSIIYLAILCTALISVEALSVPLVSGSDSDHAATKDNAVKPEADKPVTFNCPDYSWGCGNDWNPTISVPALKFRQGEQVQVFQGLAVGIQLNNLFLAKGSLESSIRKALIITPALMLSTEKTLNSTTGVIKSDYVFAAAILFGIKKDSTSFQIGWSYDMVSSESAAALQSRPRTSILFNIGAGF